MAAVFDNGVWLGVPKAGELVRLRRVDWNKGEFFELPYELVFGQDGRFLADLWHDDGTVKDVAEHPSNIHDTDIAGDDEQVPQADSGTPS